MRKSKIQIPAVLEKPKRGAKENRTLTHTFTRVNEIQIPAIMFNPIKFSEPLINVGFSELGGLIPSQVIMMTGTPGAGKTTLCSKFGSVVKSEKDPIFLSLEMSEFQLVLQAKKIDGFEKFFIVREVSDVDKLLLDMEIMQPSFIVLDSIQELAAKCFNGSDKAQIDIVAKFTEFAKRTFIPVILIGHCTKGGDYKGPSQLLHKVDTHMHVFLEKETGDRYYKFNKNRFGGDASSMPWRIASDKVVIGNHYDYSQKVTQEEIVEALGKFRERSKLKNSGDFQDIKPIIPLIINFLTDKYSDYMKGNTVSKTDRVKNTFEAKGERCTCWSHKSLINWSPLYFNALRDGMTSCYKKETPFEIVWSDRKKEDMMIYTIFHEFTHLFNGMQNHKLTFFKEVERFCRENSWMFENGDLKLRASLEVRPDSGEQTEDDRPLANLVIDREGNLQNVEEDEE